MTLDRTMRLLQRAIEVPGLSLELAILLVDYHIDRNKVARQSHAKTWCGLGTRASNSFRCRTKWCIRQEN